MPQPKKRRRPAPIAARQPARLRPLLRTVAVQIAAAAADNPRRTFSLVAYTGEAMRIWPYDLPVVIDLASIDLSTQRLPALYDHCPDVDFVVGQVESVSLADGNLLAAGVFTVTDAPPDRNYAAKVLAKADAGYQWQVSVGGNPATMEEVKAGTTINVNGRDYAGPVLVARGLSLRELSFVVLGGDRRTSAVVARHSKLKGTAMTFEEWLLSLGFEDAASLSEVQRANLTQLYNSEYPDGEGDGEGEDPPTNAEADPPVNDEETPPANAHARRPVVQARDAIAQRRRLEAAETARINDIRRLCAAANNPTMTLGTGTTQRTEDIAAHAIAENWPVNEVRREIELQQLRASRPQGPAGHVRSHDRDCTVQALTGAMILRARGRLDDRAYSSTRAARLLPSWLRASLNDAQRNQYMEAAHRYADMSLIDMAREALRLDGRDAPRDRGDLIQAAFSGSTLTNIFTTNVNAILLASYMEVEDTTLAWTTETDVADFKTQERPRVEVPGGLKKLPRGTEADHAKYADNSESYKIARYSLQFVIDEQDMIDDSLGAMSTVPQDFGRAAARLRPDLVYAILLANPTLAATTRELFNATDGNLDTTSSLATGTLKAAISAMLLFQENGVNLGIRPTHILVPPTLDFTARELLQSTGIIVARGGTTDLTVERGNANTLQGLVTPIAEPRLENGLTDPSSNTAYSGSASTWFLASTFAHTIEVAFLRGTGRAPRVRSFVLDKGKYGMGWDVSMDIGAKALDWKGLHKATA